jgi:hypothetical protein
MLRSVLLSLTTLLAIAATSPAARAQSFTALYDFTGAAGTQASTAATAQPTNGTASVLARGAGLGANAASNAINSNGWALTTTLDTALNDYYELTIAPNSGFTLSLTGLAYTERRSGTGPQSFEIRASTNGFATALTGTGYTIPLATTTDLAKSFSFSPIPALQNVTSAITLRLYGYNATNTNGTYRLSSPAAGQGLTISGSIRAAASGSMAPEPATLCLMLSGLLLLTHRRRTKLNMPKN